MQRAIQAAQPAISEELWKKIGKPVLQDVTHLYKSASKHEMPVMGSFTGKTEHSTPNISAEIPYVVTMTSDINLVGLKAIRVLQLKSLEINSVQKKEEDSKSKSGHIEVDPFLQ